MSLDDIRGIAPKPRQEGPTERLNRNTTFLLTRFRRAQRCAKCKGAIPADVRGWRAKGGRGGWAHDTVLCDVCVRA